MTLWIAGFIGGSVAHQHAPDFLNYMANRYGAEAIVAILFGIISHALYDLTKDGRKSGRAFSDRDYRNDFRGERFRRRSPHHFTKKGKKS
jgi:hypothetical protein